MINIRQSTLLKSILTNAVILIVMMLLFVPQSEVGDDSVIYAILAGGLGEASNKTIYINWVYGELLRCLISMCSEINWYILSTFSLVFCSLTAIAFVNFRKFENKLGSLINILLISVLAYEGYVNYQFSKTAGILACAGCYLIFYAIMNEEEPLRPVANAFLVIVGMLMSLVGFCHRFNMVLCVLGVFFGFGVIRLVCGIRNANNQKSVKELGELGKYLVVFGILVCMFAALQAIDSRAYNTAEWNYYKEFNSARSRIRDYPIPDYESNEDAYESIGMSEAAYDNMMIWNFADPEYYTIDRLHQVAELSEASDSSLDDTDTSLAAFWKDYSPKFEREMIFWLAGFMMIVLLLFVRKPWKTLAAALYAAVFCCAMFYYMYCSGRYGLNRIDTSVWTAGILVVLLMINKKDCRTWTLKEDDSDSNGKTGYVQVVGICFLFCAVFFGLTFERYCSKLRISQRDYYSEMSKVRAVYDGIDASRDKVYLMEAKCDYLGYELAAFDAYAANYADNRVWLGGWYTQSPLMWKSWGQNGITNPFRDVINNGNMLIVDKTGELIDKTVAYISERYNSKASYLTVKEYNGYSFYRVLTDYDHVKSYDIQHNSEFIPHAHWKVNRKGNTTFVEGYAYVEGIDSFAQDIYVLLEDKTTGNCILFPVVQYENNERFDRPDAYLSAFTCDISASEYGPEYEGTWRVVVKVNGEYIEVFN